MIKLLANYSTVIDGEHVILKGIHKLPSDIEADLIKRGFAEKITEDDLTKKQLDEVRDIKLVDGKLTETEEIAEDSTPPVEDSTPPIDDSKITLESLLAMTEEEIDALAVEKGITLNCKKQDTKANELFVALGA